MNKNKKKGFSLVELIVVIAIIGILAAIAVPKYSAYKESANKKADQATAKLLADATLMVIEEGTALSGNIKDTDVDKTKWNTIVAYIGKTVEKKSANAKEWIVNVGTSTITVKLMDNQDTSKEIISYSINY